jgi:hypothetical protein
MQHCLTTATVEDQIGTRLKHSNAPAWSHACDNIPRVSQLESLLHSRQLPVAQEAGTAAKCRKPSGGQTSNGPLNGQIVGLPQVSVILTFKDHYLEVIALTNFEPSTLTHQKNKRFSIEGFSFFFLANQRYKSITRQLVAAHATIPSRPCHAQVHRLLQILT